MTEIEICNQLIRECRALRSMIWHSNKKEKRIDTQIEHIKCMVKLLTGEARGKTNTDSAFFAGELNYVKPQEYDVQYPNNREVEK